MKQANVTSEDHPPIDVEPEPVNNAVAVRDQNQAVGAALPPEQIQAPRITAQQAKIEAVAALTMKAYERAAMLELTPEETEKLAADFPDEAFKPGAAGKENLIYIEHAFLRDRLSQVFGMGKWALVPRSRWEEKFMTKGYPARGGLPAKPPQDASRVYVEAMLIIRGCFVAEAIGEMEYYPGNASQNYGDAVEGAKTAALRRCCKELGVGLQAWKKDWCDGWWARRKAATTVRKAENRAETGSGRSGGVSTGTPPSQDAGNVAKRNDPMAQKPSGGSLPQSGTSGVSQTKTETVQPWPQTQKTKDWLINTKLAQCQELALEYFQKAGILLPNETLADFPLRWLPLFPVELAALKEALTNFGNGAEAVKPYQPHELPSEVTKAKAAPASYGQKTEKTVTPKVDKPGSAPGKDPEWWREVIVPIPHKGEKRADYISNPDTIGSLYDQCKQGIDEACKRLYGFVGHYEPKGWQKRDGTQMPPSDTDLNFRAALDAFAEWHEKNGKDEPTPEEEEAHQTPED